MASIDRAAARRRPTVGIAILVAFVACLLPFLTAPAEAAAKGRADLTISKISTPAAADAGKSVRVSTTVKNSGKKAAGASVTSFLLSRDRKAGADTRLASTSKVKSLKSKKTLSRTAAVSIPAGTTAGSYYLIACADSKKKVRESSEKNNCRVGKQLRIAAASATPPTPTTPVPTTPVPTTPPAGKLTITPATFEFEPVMIGSGSGAVQKTITATNTGNAALPVMLGGGLTGSGDFAMVTDGCLGKRLAAGDSCDLEVKFDPTTGGVKTSTLTVQAGFGQASVSATASLSGTCIDPDGARLTSDLANGQFGTVPQGIATPVKTFTVTNSGTYESGTISAPTIENGAGMGYEIVAQTCAGETLEVDESCTVSVSLTARTHGDLFATLTLGAAPGGDLELLLLATGENGFLLSGGRDFGVLAVGASSAPYTASVSNASSDDRENVSVTLTGPDADQFVILLNNCSPRIESHLSCSIRVSFSPTSPGAKSAQISVRSTPGGLFTIPLTGSAETLSVSPSSDSFSAFAGDTTAAKSFTFTNLDVPTTGTLSSQLTGSDASQFAIVSDGCAGAVLVTGSTCTVTVAFKPTGSPGGKAAGITVTGTPGGTKTAQLNGTVLKPATFSVTLPGPIPFGSMPVGGAYLSWGFMLRNTGDATSAPVTMGLVSENVPGQFSIDPEECAAKVLAPNETCFFSATFAPTVVGSFTASMAITALNAVGTEVVLSGTGTP